MHPHPWLALVVIATCAAYGRAAETVAVPFRDVGFDAAAKAAAAEHKLVFIDFYTTWCGPCQMLDRQTWSDPAVGELLSEKAVCLKLDAEKAGRTLANKYAINAYPTLLLLNSDGTEVDRLVGFREPAVFTREFNAALAGKPSLTRAREAVQAAASATMRDQVMAHMKLARELAQKRQYAEALREYLWLYDTGMKAEPSFVGVRNSFLPSDMGRLARQFPPAKAALEERRDAAKARLFGDAPDRLASMEFAALSTALGDTKGLMAAFDQLPAGDPRRRGFGLEIHRELLAARRYKEAVEVHPYDAMVSLFDVVQRNGPGTARTYSLQTAADGVEALAGAGELEHAAAFRDRILAVDSSDGMKATLRDHLTRAGHPELMDAPH